MGVLRSIKLYFYLFIQVTHLYILWVALYFIASHLHTQLCVPFTWYGIIMAPIMATTPPCQALRWLIYNGGNSIITMWIITGTALIQYIKPITA